MPDGCFFSEAVSMEANEESSDWGTITPAEVKGQPSLPVWEKWPVGDGTPDHFVWQPAEYLNGYLSEGFRPTFRVHIGPDGLRRVSPVGAVEDHVAWAWQGGLAILSRHQKLDPAQL